MSKLDIFIVALVWLLVPIVLVARLIIQRRRAREWRRR